MRGRSFRVGLVLVACIGAFGGCAPEAVERRETQRTVELVGPESTVTVTVVDRAGVVIGASGEWADADPAGQDGITISPPAGLRVRWPGSCGERATLTVDRVGVDKIRVSLDSSEEVPDCRPRGFIPHVIKLDVEPAIEPQDVTFAITSTEGYPESTARPAGG